MRVLISGGAGYIATALTPILISKGHVVAQIKRNGHGTNPTQNESVVSYYVMPGSTTKELRNVIQDFQPDALLHLATAWKSNSTEDFLSSCIDSNISFAGKLAESARLERVHFLNIASYWEINSSEFEFRNDHYTNTKRAFSQLLKKMKEFSEFQYGSIFLYDNYGPADPRGKLLTSLGNSIRDNKQISLRSGAIKVNFLHINDVIQGICTGLENYQSFSCIEISNEHNFNLAHVVSEFESIAGKKLAIDWLDRRTPIEEIEIHKKIYPWPEGWKPIHSFPYGIDEIIWGQD
jgi:nucleoside-diphosphate-sugar epimerase